jgi:hypothetical protein
MRVAEVLTATILGALGTLVLLDAIRLGVGWTSDGPASGFFPFWLALTLIMTCVCIAAQSFYHKYSKPFVERTSLGPVWKVLWPAVAFVVLMHWIGLYVASAIYTAFYMRWVGRHSWGSVVCISLALALICFFVFEQWFLVPMPKGTLEAWLGY